MTAESYKCAFNGPQMTGAFSCSQGRQVVRRGGPDIGCGSDAAHQQCARLFELLKAAALARLNIADDLLTMPHSVPLKIQFGGLLGLQKCLGEPGDRVEDIHDLVSRAIEHYGDLEALPCDDVAADIAAYSITRRRR